MCRWLAWPELSFRFFGFVMERSAVLIGVILDRLHVLCLTYLPTYLAIVFLPNYLLKISIVIIITIIIISDSFSTQV